VMVRGESRWRARRRVLWARCNANTPVRRKKATTEEARGMSFNDEARDRDDEGRRKEGSGGACLEALREESTGRGADDDDAPKEGRGIIKKGTLV